LAGGRTDLVININKQPKKEVVMHLQKIKYTLLQFFLGICICCIPNISGAAVSIHTEIAWGHITQIYANHSVALDDGKIYYPSRGNLIVNIPVGGEVTLGYVVKEGKNIFFEYAPGLNSLQNSAPASAAKK
jgi:hypothetical protein